MIFFLLLISLTPGERLEYDAKFSFLNLGTMVLTVHDTIECDNEQCYHLLSELNSNPSLGFLFSLHDTIEVYSRQENLLPALYTEKLHEGSYHNHAEIRFFHDSLYALYNDTLRIDLLENTRDMLSFWYHLRTIPLIVGDTIKVNIYASEENHSIDCCVEREETVKTSLGEFQAILVSPLTEGKGVFGSGGGMHIWYTADSIRIPVQIKAKMKFGSVLFKVKEIRY